MSPVDPYDFERSWNRPPRDPDADCGESETFPTGDVRIRLDVTNGQARALVRELTKTRERTTDATLAVALGRLLHAIGKVPP